MSFISHCVTSAVTTRKKKKVVTELFRPAPGHGVNSLQPPEKPFCQRCRKLLVVVSGVVMLKIARAQPNINSLKSNKLSLQCWISDTKGLLAVKAGQRKDLALQGETTSMLKCNHESTSPHFISLPCAKKQRKHIFA